MGLNAKEKKALEALQRKAEEPDPPSGSLSYSLDLGDDKAYDRAVKLGLVAGDDGGDDDDDDDDSDPSGDEVPRRRSSLADRMMGGE